jgi:pyruvate dehydrogenase E2 component (dihydrolipoamide acetyltransferase)
VRKEFRLPDVGEGLTEADIVAWHVKPGDTVTINQIIVDIETAKAVVELPSPYAGTVSALLVDAGQTVDVGTPIIAVEVPGADDAAPEPEQPEQPEPEQQQAAPATAEEAPPARQPVLVGYGVKPGSTSRRPRKKAPTRPGSYPATPSMPPAGGGAAGPASSPRARRPPGRNGRVPSPSRPCGAWPGTSASTSAAWRAAGRKAWSPGMTWSARPTRAGSRPRELRPCRAPLGRGRPPRPPPRSGSRCAGYASTPPPRWWQARSPRRT